LIDKGFAYAPGNGDVYFRVTKDPGYGKLSGRRIEDMQAGARIEIGEQKEHPMDFALWKCAKPGEPAWDSPWGKGRPGWHIECSAMNLAELGEQIDIHGGGNDLVFPHHENEIAQTECFTGKPFARYWMHNGMLQLGGEKMSKSIGNIVSIKEFLSKRDADVMRLLVLNGSYRAPLVFNEETLDSAEKGLERLKSGFRPASPSAAGLVPQAATALVTQSEAAQQTFTDSMDDDFNSCGALAALFELVRAINISRDGGATSEQLLPAQVTLRALAGVLGLRLAEKKARVGAVVDENWINDQIKRRQAARENKDWSTSDDIRNTLKDLGILLEDGKDGTSWRWE
jgi:cysteinyl-tRNA synthetase